MPSEGSRSGAAAPPSCLRAYAFGRDSRHVYIAYELCRTNLPGGRARRRAQRQGCHRGVHADLRKRSGTRTQGSASRRGSIERAPSQTASTRSRCSYLGLTQFVEAETLTAQGDVPHTRAPERLAGGTGGGLRRLGDRGHALGGALRAPPVPWQTSMLDTARAIESGHPRWPSSGPRGRGPDLPRRPFPLAEPGAAPLRGRPLARVRGIAPSRRQKRSRGSSRLAVRPSPSAKGALRCSPAASPAGRRRELPFYPHSLAVGLALAGSG